MRTELGRRASPTSRRGIAGLIQHVRLVGDFLGLELGFPEAARLKEFQAHAPRLFLNYFKAIEAAFPRAWAGKKYSIKTGTALRAFIRVSPDVMAAARESKRDPFDAAAIRQALVPWSARIGDARFETEGPWRQKQAGGTRGTVEILVRELRDALRDR
jgi:hypothetical protein